MTILIFKNSTPQRVDKYLSDKYSSFSRRYFQNGLKNKEVLINDKTKSPSYKLKEGDKIKINLSLIPKITITKLPPNNKVKFEVVVKYPDFFIINKPAGLIVHPSRFDIENNSIPPSLAGGLLALDHNLKNVGEDFTRPGIVHRLDKNTSGLMIIPRNQRAFLEFKQMFKSHQIQKTYLSLNYYLQRKNLSIINNESKIKWKTIDSYIGKSKRNHLKQATAKNQDYLIRAKEATTRYRFLKAGQLPCVHRVGKIKKQSLPIILVKSQPQTGRKHQIRVHLNSIGLPLLGDQIYTNKLLKNCNQLIHSRYKNKYHLLQAQRLAFTFRGEKYSFSNKAPYWLELIE